jgi:eukaryotic-like serine/threonine-protein kinase
MAEGAMLAGRYLLRERIGAGGMGEVWKATDQVLGRTVAVKLILHTLVDDPEFLRRFLAEARAMASVRHPGVVAIHDFHGDAAGAYLVMEYVDGEPLSRVLSRLGRLDTVSTMDIVRQAALALQAVHDRGIVHRDIKPANLLLRTDGTLALADFGIALGSGNTGLTGTGAILGTPSYLAPEQVMGQPASPRTDVYALGVVAYECLTGRRPFVGDNPYQVAMQRVKEPPPPFGPDVPPAVAEVVYRALAADPGQRWPSADAFALVAAQAIEDPWGEVTTVSSTAPTRRLRTLRRRPAVLVLAIVLALVGAGVLGIALWPSGGGTPAAAGGPGSGGPAGQSTARLPKGYVACGALLCPAAPMCWHGLVMIGDDARPPAVSACSDPHYWETFAAAYLPADAVTPHDLSHLMERQDIQAICSEQEMAKHSRDPSALKGWRRDAWPIAADPYTVLVHCLAGSPDGETPGAAFH